jgi:hypothetical protein
MTLPVAMFGLHFSLDWNWLFGGGDGHLPPSRKPRRTLAA